MNKRLWTGLCIFFLLFGYCVGAFYYPFNFFKGSYELLGNKVSNPFNFFRSYEDKENGIEYKFITSYKQNGINKNGNKFMLVSFLFGEMEYNHIPFTILDVTKCKLDYFFRPSSNEYKDFIIHDKWTDGKNFYRDGKIIKK